MTRHELLIAGGAACLLAVPAVAQQHGVIPAVQAETARSGWPHQATMREAHAVTVRVARTYLPGRQWYGAVRCWTPTGMAGRWVCGVHRARVILGAHDQPVRRARQTPQSFRVTVRVWEDGAYRITGRRP